MNIEEAYKGYFFKIEPLGPWPDPPKRKGRKCGAVNEDVKEDGIGQKDALATEKTDKNKEYIKE